MRPGPFPCSICCYAFAVAATSLLRLSSVSAVPCIETGTSLPPSESASAGDAAPPEHIFVTPDSGLDLTSVFSCEGGDFDVFWSGIVYVPGTIYIGRGTTVKILGDVKGGKEGSDYENKELSASLPQLPNGLAAAAVSTAFQQKQQQSNDTSTPTSAGETGSDTEGDSQDAEAWSGPLFFVDGGQLFLENLAVRGGDAGNYTGRSSSIDGGGDGVINGGGVHAVDANVTVTGCEFEECFAQHLGGGVFTNRSTLVVVGSAFRRCQADVVSSPGDDALGAGGGIGVENTDVLIDGTLFDSCYASKRGGGFHQEDGYVSVLNSFFYNNTAGSSNEEAEDPIGEGGAISFVDCRGSFDGLTAGGANDSVFLDNHTAHKGGALLIWSKSAPSQVELRRCTFENSTTGEAIKDDPQGEGGAIAIGTFTTLVLTESLFTRNVCGKKGGVINMSVGDNWEEGPVSIFRNSTFMYNRASLDNGGVINVGSYGLVVVEGDDNVFEFNESPRSGGAFAATSDTKIIVEGGEFNDNESDKGGVAWTKGNFTILGGVFRRNNAFLGGGVLFVSEESSTVLKGGLFEGNRAQNGGVAQVPVGGALFVEGGEYSGNLADDAGGVFASIRDGTVEIAGGSFVANRADFGGFLYMLGGNVSCSGASVVGNEAVDGSGVYVIANATVDWACDLRENSAMSGAAIYAREGSTVVVRGITLFNNIATAGSIIFVISGSHLITRQVVFNDTLGGAELSAVQVDQQSSYKAEDTSFMGVYGEAVVLSGGTLFLDDCDFGGSTAPVLVHSEGQTPVIRNAILGNNNYYGENMQPKAMPMVDVNVTCDGWVGESSSDGRDGDESSFSGTSSSSPCSEGSQCLEGDLGVYCACYVRESTLEQDSTRPTCVGGDVQALHLTTDVLPTTIFYPEVLEGYLLLSLDPVAAPDDVINTTTTSTSAGVVWNASALAVFFHQEEESPGVEMGVVVMNWTVSPSTGLLLPGQSIAVGVRSLPNEGMDGLATVGFAADGRASPLVDHDGDDAMILDEVSQGTVSFDVEFYHCKAGQIWWDGDITSATTSEEHSCAQCVDVVEEGAEGLDCSLPGATTRTLPIKDGYWRASLDSFIIHECWNKDACKGGSVVAGVVEYCNDGYEGPQCALCASGYAGGVANACHECTESFKAGAYFLVFFALLLVLVVAALLSVYLVGGRGAVSTTKAKIKRSVSLTSQRFDRSFRGATFSQRGFASRGSDSSCMTGASTSSSESKQDEIIEQPTWSSSGHAVHGAGGTSIQPRPAMSTGGSTRTSASAADTSSSLDQESTNQNDTKKTAAARITAMLAALPLSKLKIVVVVWQISNAFAEVTKAPFPPAYNKFLSIISVFSFDFGWTLSAACLVTDFSFYDKLLTVTIGPMVLLCLLGITFSVGSKKNGGDAPRSWKAISVSPVPIAEESIDHSSPKVCVAKGASDTKTDSPVPPSRPVHQAALKSGPKTDSPVLPSRPVHPAALKSRTKTDAPVPPSRPVHPAALKSRSSSARTIFEEGPGGSSDVEQHRLWELFARHTTMTLVILYLVYSQVSTVVFQAFACEDFPEIGKRYLRADFRIDCDTSKHTAFMIYAVVMIFIYPLGIPAAFCFFLVRQKSRINPPISTSSGNLSGDETREKMERRRNDPAIAPTYILWNAFVPDCYYYEVIECIRRLLLTGVLVFVKPDTAGQVAFGCIFAFVSLMVFELLRPHFDRHERQLYRAGCLLIFFSNFLALTIKAEVASPNSSGSTVYSVVLVIVNILFFMAVFLNTWAVTKEAVSNHDVTDIMFGFSVRDVKRPKNRNAKKDNQDGSVENSVEEDLEASPHIAS